MKSYRYILEGLDCANCAKKVEDKIASTEGYKKVNVNFSTLKLSFQTEKEGNIKKEISDLVRSVEPEVTVIEETEKTKESLDRTGLDIIRLIVGVFIYFIGTHFYFGTTIEIIATVIAIAVLLVKIFKKAVVQIFKNRVLDENALITISAIGACFVGKTMEGIMVITLYEIGKILESKAVNKTRKSISALMNIKPEYANLKKEEDIIQVNPDEVKIRRYNFSKNRRKNTFRWNSNKWKCRN